MYCHWSNVKNDCTFSIKADLLIDFINKIAEEFIQNGLKANEVLQKENYVVSVRTAFDGRTARATTNKVDDESLKRVVAASETLARPQISRMTRAERQSFMAKAPVGVSLGDRSIL